MAKADNPRAVAGDNSGNEGTETLATKEAKDRLKSYVERIEKMEDEKSSIVLDIKSIYDEAKGNGYNVKALRTAIRLRKMDRDERAEQEALVDLYMSALGVFG